MALLEPITVYIVGLALLLAAGFTVYSRGFIPQQAFNVSAPNDPTTGVGRRGLGVGMAWA